MNAGTVSAGVNNLYSPGLSLNLPTSLATLTNIDLNFPYRAFFSFGGSHWNFQAGRDRLGWGAGETGNLMLGDQMRYHQYLKFATYFDAFKFSTVAAFFPHPKDVALAATGANGLGSQNVAIEGFKMFLAHRLEFRLFKDKVGLTLNESLMYQTTTGTLDIRVLNPIGFFHNYYLRPTPTHSSASSSIGPSCPASTSTASSRWMISPSLNPRRRPSMPTPTPTATSSA